MPQYRSPTAAYGSGEAVFAYVVVTLIMKAGKLYIDVSVY